jgi:8-oxo-dGTP pyrophosphatase MutT (NUDIX family)
LHARPERTIINRSVFIRSEAPRPPASHRQRPMSDRSAPRAHIERLRRGLAGVEPAPREALANNVNAAAVLVPIFERRGDLHVVYIRRSDRVESHRGQVAFPGGRVDPGDLTLLDAALREAREEVGLDPRAVEVLGAFETVSTMTTGIIVAPFVGVIPSDAGLQPAPSEVAEIFDVPLSALRDPRYRGDFEWRRPGGTAARFPAILYGGQTIWGLTLRITERMLAILDS